MGAYRIPLEPAYLLASSHLSSGLCSNLLVSRAGFGQDTTARSARPRVWWQSWHPFDLEWMKRVGVGGVQTFDASLMIPEVVEKRRRRFAEARPFLERSATE